MKSFRIVMWVWGAILLFLFACQRSQPNVVVNQTAGQEKFRWLDSTRDSQIWNRVLGGLRQELSPDDPRKVPPHYAATQYKYIYKIGVFRAAALVIIGSRETKDSPGEDYFNAYSYNLRSGSKGAIVTDPPRPPGTYPPSDLWTLFEVIKPAQFDRSPAPDVVFTYDSCAECEAQHFLASFEYVSGKGWAARQWDTSYRLYLESDPSPGDDVVSGHYLLKIKDWDGDGFDALALRRREVTQVSKRRQEVNDSTTIYKAENGKLVGRTIRDPSGRERINIELCSDSELSFCKQSK